MAGTITGAIKARNKNLANDPDFYRKIGSIGGQQSGNGGFFYHKSTICNCDIIEGEHTKPQCSGKKGTISRRLSKKNI